MDVGAVVVVVLAVTVVVVVCIHGKSDSIKDMFEEMKLTKQRR